MPLQQLPDHLDDATHRQLDDAVNAVAASQDFPEVLTRPRDLLASLLLQHLLNFIITHSNDDMNPKFQDGVETIALFNAHEELYDMLSSAWKERSYRKIRNLAILKKQPEKTAVTSKALTLEQELELHQRLSSSFEAQYRGAAVEGFYEYLTKIERLFKRQRKSSFYAKICSIVQSSGTGKSRMLTELSKKGVVVIYMNLRKETDRLGFPARDSVPSKILTEFPPSSEDYRVVCCAFFVALFDTIREYLQAKKNTESGEKDVMSWVARMCDMSDPPRDDTRMQFFKKLDSRYNEVHGAHVDALFGHREAILKGLPNSRNNEMDDKAPDSDAVMATSSQIKSPPSSDPPNKTLLSGPPNISWRMGDAYQEMAQCLEELLTDDSDHPKLVIAFDEAHRLTPMHTMNAAHAQMTYRPADIFCRVVNKYSCPHDTNHAVWVVLASTASKVADFSPPDEKQKSDYVAIRGERPYIQLGWDQSALGLGEIHVEKVAQLGHVASYGRPLWQSLRAAEMSPEKVLNFASSKLCGGHDFDASNTNHVLIVLGQRFGVDIALGHPESVGHLENGVASHLRVCLGTTLDPYWRSTAYPSEPLLSCVAAHDLHEKPEELKNALATLLNAVNSGMINMGKLGELASRLLWLLAKDLFVRTEAKNAIIKIPSSWDDDLIDCQMIPVVDWLEFIFGSRIWDNDNTQTSLAREIFKDAYLNFSHWVSMEENITGSREEKSIGLYEWTLRHWQRTSAVQCCHQRPLVDKAIPIYFRGGPENAPATSRMSHIFISDKAGKSQSSEGNLATITRRHESIRGDEDVSDSLPYIAILADLGRATNFSVTFPERDVDDRCLRIYAAGVDTTTYPFLAKYPALMTTLQGLVHLQQTLETETPYVQYLEGQAKFGSTPAAMNMKWEHGKTTPKL